MRDYTFVCTDVMTCASATVVNIQTDTHPHKLSRRTVAGLLMNTDLLRSYQDSETLTRNVVCCVWEYLSVVILLVNNKITTYIPSVDALNARTSF